VTGPGCRHSLLNRLTIGLLGNDCHFHAGEKSRIRVSYQYILTTDRMVARKEATATATAMATKFDAANSPS